MAEPTATNEPAYISSHSADVILSDIRPFKLKADALRCVNVLLDELLFNILTSSGSLTTDRLRASLLGLLPTSLGKEALLEAEVELRAYWDRAAPAGIPLPSPDDDDTASFNLQWAFELLRNKCEAYSTLNEADEDPAAESRINDNFGRQPTTPSKSLLVAPAALYLTAIIEAVCEHVLSNVGRVAARDSSRINATISDLFIALCEDASVYGYFKNTKVYHQIELLSKSNKSRRSKSFSRGESSMFRNIASQQAPSAHSRSASVSRASSDASSMANPPRSSFDKSRALKMFANGKNSIEKEDSLAGHGKSASVASTKNGSVGDNENSSTEDAALQQEFDDLMRSSGTMKMSLTPDRLKTMEVYKQEKEQRGHRRPAPLSFKPESSGHPSRNSSQRTSIRQVDSIIEDDEENTNPTPTTKPQHRTRQTSVVDAPVTQSPPLSNSRTRSVSTSSAPVPPVLRKTRSPSVTIPPSFTAKSAVINDSKPASDAIMGYHRDQGRPMGTYDSNGMPPRTRVKQRNPESLDLDDVMGGFDDESPKEPPGLKSKGPTPSGKPGKRVPKVSTTTRDLMDFLAEGPPPDTRPSGPAPRDGQQFMDFLAEGPPTHGPSPVSAEAKPKAGRLQRMISKLNLGEKSKADNIVKSSQAGSKSKQPALPTHPPNPLANRPIPPRPPQPIVPPVPISPPLSSHGSLPDDRSIRAPSRKPSGSISHMSQESAGERSTTSSPPPPPPPVPHLNRDNIPSPRPIPHLSNSGSTNGTKQQDFVGSAKEASHAVDTYVIPPKPTPTIHRKPVPAAPNLLSATPFPTVTTRPPARDASTPLDALPEPHIGAADARDMQRLLASATTADECRLIVDMFLTRAGIIGPISSLATTPSAAAPVISAIATAPVITRSELAAPDRNDPPYPTPPPSTVKHTPEMQTQAVEISDSSLEDSVVDMLLGGVVSATVAIHSPPRPPRRRAVPKGDVTPEKHKEGRRPRAAYSDQDLKTERPVGVPPRRKTPTPPEFSQAHNPPSIFV